MRSKMETHADEAEKRVRDIRRATALGTRVRKILAQRAAPPPDSSWHTSPRCRVTVSLSLFFGRNRQVGIGGRERRQNSHPTASMIN